MSLGPALSEYARTMAAADRLLGEKRRADRMRREEERRERLRGAAGRDPGTPGRSATASMRSTATSAAYFRRVTKDVDALMAARDSTGMPEADGDGGEKPC